MPEDHPDADDLLKRLETGGGIRLSAELWGTNPASRDSLLGRVLSGYELYLHLADGGMSRVYRARRADGRFDRDVAVKVSLAGVMSESLRERFFQEQQILAGLNHPGIAQLYDAGISDEGWPYIVMELVEGTAIDAYCAGAELDEKIDLTMRICEALSFAHTRLVVHRDIKPANVLVTRDGEPKLLDFGIAKLLSTGSTATQTRTLTPRYASPEQLLGQPASVASDVYQMGLLLAEVLHPELIERPGGPGDALRLASDSTDLELDSEIARSLPRDVVSIVEQCVRTNPLERYAEVSEVREDLDRFRRGYPVRASGNSRRYRARKFVRRNLSYLSTAAIAVAAFLISSTWYLMEVNEARDNAEFEAATSRQVTGFLADLFRSSAPSQLRGEDLTAGELLDRGLKRIDQELGDRPLVHAQLQSVLGSVVLDLGQYDTADRLLGQALAVQQRTLGPEHVSTLETRTRLADLATERGDLKEAERLFLEVLDAYARIFGPAHEETLDARNRLGAVLRMRGEFARAAEIQQALVESHRRNGQLASLEGVSAVTGLAISTIQAGDPQAAIPYFEQALQLSREVLGPRHRQTIGAINNMAVTYQETGQPERALPYSEEAYQQSLAVYGPEHPTTLSSAVNLATTLRQIGRLQEARTYVQGALEKALEQLPPSHAAVDRALTEMGQVELAAGNYAAAERHFLELLEIEREHLGQAHMYTIGTQLKAASAIMAQQRFREASELLESAVELLYETQGPDHQEVLLAEKQLAHLRIQEGRLDEARRLLLRVVPALTAHFGEDARQVAEARQLLSRANNSLGD